ncbi:MAG: hypothetical protein K6C36_00785 [Clostridia bacterium]|nr:hypothetical protein [Clostridia bacterium]
MKKMISLVCALALVLALASCATKPSVPGAVTTESPSSDVPAETVSAGLSEDSEDGLPGLEVLSVESVEYDGYVACLAVIRNNTDSATGAEGSLSAYDSSGGELVTVYDRAELGAGETTYMYFTFESRDPADFSFDCEPVEPELESIQADVRVKVTDRGNRLIVCAGNDSEYSAEEPCVMLALYDDEGVLAALEPCYVCDHDGQLKPGAERYEEVNPDVGYSYYKAFYRFPSAGNTPMNAPGAAGSPLDCSETYEYRTEFGETVYMVAVRNDGDRTLSVEGNAAALDADGAPIAAENASLACLGAGDTSLLEFFFIDAADAQDFSFSVQYDETENYTPVLDKIEKHYERMGDEVVVSCLNNADDPELVAEYFTATVVFFDSGECVGKQTKYMSAKEDGLDLAPDDPAAEQRFSASGDFDDFKVFFYAQHANFDPEDY